MGDSIHNISTLSSGIELIFERDERNNCVKCGKSLKGKAKYYTLKKPYYRCYNCFYNTEEEDKNGS